MEIYAELEIFEVWRYDGRTLTMSQLPADRACHVADESRAFPGLRPIDVEHFMDPGRTTDKLRWTRELREWVRDESAP